MNEAHFRFWPKGLPHRLHVPQTSLYFNLEAAAARYPGKPAIVFYDTVLSYARLKAEVDALAAWLQGAGGVARGDRVLLVSQNCPQFVIAYYAVLRADAVVVPVNAMCSADEIAHYLADSGATLALAASELLPNLRPHLESGRLRRVLVHRYADYIPAEGTLKLPDWLRAAGAPQPGRGIALWPEAVGCGKQPAPHRAGSDDLCLLPYTSGTTGHPKGCIHTHGTLMAALASSMLWRGLSAESVFLAVAPMFHLLGMQNGMNLPLLAAGTIVMLPRWDREAAAILIERHRVSVWAAPPAMLVDFFAQPGIDRFDLSSLALLFGGGAAMPEAVAAMLREKFGIAYNEGYGLTETASFLHGNPLQRPKRQCLGVPAFDVDTRVVDPDTLRELPPGEVGELVTCGPQVMKGYWNNPAADREAFIELDGKRFFRTGDLCHADQDGYFFMRDRLKRMINVSGYKVWPAETESVLYGHPAVHEACVIAVRDERRGEAVKLFLVLKPEARGRVARDDILAWCRERMAAYKVPRDVEFVDELPKSGTGKILWRELQERENRAAAPAS